MKTLPRGGLFLCAVLLGCTGETVASSTTCEPLAGVYRWIWTTKGGTCGDIDPRIAEAPSFGCAMDVRTEPRERSCAIKGTATCTDDALTLSCVTTDGSVVECDVEVKRPTCSGSYALRMERATP